MVSDGERVLKRVHKGISTVAAQCAIIGGNRDRKRVAVVAAEDTRIDMDDIPVSIHPSACVPSVAQAGVPSDAH